jgi:hypothetical protein
MTYYDRNNEEFDEISNNLSVITPFVGAGLSAFAYPTWKRFLSEEISNHHMEAALITKLDNLMACHEYLDVASELEKNLLHAFFMPIWKRHSAHRGSEIPISQP